jgi:DHA2 family multidrug resistance protein
VSAGATTVPGGDGAPGAAPVAPAVTQGHPPLRGLELALATWALSLGSFMNFLDLSIANVSVPSIAGALSVSPTQGTWVITSYAMAEAIMLPLTGWLGNRFGQVRMFTASTLLFTLASLLCGLSVSFPMLLSARILQGMVGAAMVPLAQSLLINCYAPHQRGLALGLWSMTAILAPIAGPLAGGWITENLTWHWIFLVNLPVGIFVALLVRSLLRDRETPTRRQPVDWTGLALLTVGVGSLQFLLDRGNELDWFESDLIVALACTAAIALIAFVVWELTDAHPIVDLRLFARRNFAIGSICVFIGMVSFFGTLVTLPLWLQAYQGYSAQWAGRAVATGGVFAVIMGPIVGANLHRIDARAVSSFGFIAFAVAAMWSAHFTPDVDFWTVAQTRLYIGIGISCFFLPLTTITLAGLPANQYAAASGLSNFIRIIGSSLGTAVVVGTWDRHGIEQHAQMVEHVEPYAHEATSYLAQLQAMGLSPQGALAQVDRIITSQSYLNATNWVLWSAGLLMLCLLPLVWLAKPPFVARVGDAH